MLSLCHAAPVLGADLTFSTPEISLLDHSTVRLLDLGPHAAARVVAVHRDGNRISTNSIVALNLSTESMLVAGSLPSNGVVADLTGSDRTDLFIINPSQGKARLLVGDGQGGFLPAVLYDLAAGATGLAVMRESAGKHAILVSHAGSGMISIFRPATGGGLITPPQMITVGGTPIDLVSADFDSDGKADIAVVDHFADRVQIWLRDGGGFRFAGSIGVGSRPTKIIAADVTSDGRIDLITANSNSGSITILENFGGGNFNTYATVGVGVHPGLPLVIDLDQDGRMDLVVPLTGESAMAVVRNEGAGAFTRSTLGLEWRSESVLAMDIDDDGRPDLIAASRITGAGAVFRNLTEPAVGVCPGDINGDLYVNLSDFSILAVNFGAGVPSNTRGDVNGDGRVDLADFSILAVHFGSVCGEF